MDLVIYLTFQRWILPNRWLGPKNILVMKNDQIPGSNKIALKIKTSQARQAKARSKGAQKAKNIVNHHHY